MKNILLSAFFAATLVFGFSSCKDEKDAADCSAAYATDLQSASTALQTASTTYAGSAQTVSDCNALKAAYQDYIDVLDSYASCAAFTAQQQADINQAIQNAQDAKDTIC